MSAPRSEGPDAVDIGDAMDEQQDLAWVRVVGRVRWRRWLSRALLLAPAALVVLVDIARRRSRMQHYVAGEMGFYALSALFGLVVWGSLVALASRKRGRTRWAVLPLLGLLAMLSVGGQTYTFARYKAYLDHRSILVGTSFLPSVGQQLWSDRHAFASALLPPLVGIALLVIAVRRLAPLRPRFAGTARDLAAGSLLCAMFVSQERGAEQGAPPDVLYFSALGQLARARWDHNETVERVHPTHRSPMDVPPLTARPPASRNVLLIVTESVRAKSVCVAYDEGCAFTPFSNRAVPDRLPFLQMRALDSTTAVSLAVMWAGVPPETNRDLFHKAPLVFEYARAAGMATGYWTSQNLLFGNSGVWLEGAPFTKSVSGTELDPDATLEIGADDEKALEHALGDLTALKSPFFGVVHLSNTHFPYRIDSADAPFHTEEDPETDVVSRYQNAIYLQDKSVGSFLERFRRGPHGRDTVILFISDHGEQMREKGAVGHTGTIYEPEIHVPFWIDAPAGTLTEIERHKLEGLRDELLTQLDVLPTLLDLLGLWDASSLRPFRANMRGESLLRGGSRPDRPLLLTNCTELWACAFKNWGAMRGAHKLLAHQGEHAWQCFDVRSDPEELHDLGLDACGPLRDFAEGALGGTPFGGRARAAQ